jgi:hypothetical protein
MLVVIEVASRERYDGIKNRYVMCLIKFVTAKNLQYTGKILKKGVAINFRRNSYSISC